jgi:hypothetical protein
MQSKIQPSPMLAALNLTRLNAEAMSFEDLEEHYKEVLDTLAELNDYINSPSPKSREALADAKKRAEALAARLPLLRDLIQFRQSERSMMQLLQSASDPTPSMGMPSLGRRPRVIRPLSSADNAASGPSTISGNEPSARDSKSAKGGEAKEAARPQSGEASLQAKR